MKSMGSATPPRRVLAHLPVRLAGAAVAVVTLAASLLATAPPAGAAVLGSASPVVWNGTDLVTAAISAKYGLYAYEQVPGASSWTRQLVGTTTPDREAFIKVSMTATADSVQIAAVDGTGAIWFYQQIDGQSTWSAGQDVGFVTLGNVAGTQTPQIAWTGVPGHTGTNSVITIADASGDILFWYENSSGGWTQQSVVDGTPQNEFYDAALTATDKGIVIAAAGSNGAFQSWFQAYSTKPWSSDGSLGVGSGQSFDSVSVTWDGTNVDADAAYNGGSGALSPDELMFMWKPDSSSFWHDEDILGPDSAEPFDNAPGITFTGSNLLLTAGQQMSSTQQRLDFWWQGSLATNFNFESVAKAKTPSGFGPPQITFTGGASAPEAVITAPFTTNNFQTSGLNDWTEPAGSSTWTKHVVTPA